MELQAEAEISLSELERDKYIKRILTENRSSKFSALFQ